MRPLTEDEIVRALEESARSGNYFLMNAVRSMAAEINELKDREASARFAQGLEGIT